MVAALFSVYLASLLALPACAVSIFTNPGDLTSSEYDFVVVGGGTAVGTVFALYVACTNMTKLRVSLSRRDCLKILISEFSWSKPAAGMA